MEIQKFNPTKAEIQAVVLEVENLTIAGVDDIAGYEAVKAGKKKLADYRIEITKFGKGQREEAIKWQKEVLRQEKELLLMIEPTETKLKNELEAIDEEKKRKEREVLLPSRRKLLDGIGMTYVTDQFILDQDEKAFAEFFNNAHADFLKDKAEKLQAEQDRIDREKREIESAKIREAEMEQAKKEAAEKAKKEAEKKAKEDLDRVEKEKQAEIDKIKRDQEEKDRKAKEDADRKKKEDEDRIAAEKADQEKAEKNRRYRKWLKDNGYTEELRQSGEMHVMRDGNTFTLYKKVDRITI